MILLILQTTQISLNGIHARRMVCKVAVLVVLLCSYKCRLIIITQDTLLFLNVRYTSMSFTRISLSFECPIWHPACHHNKK